MWWNRLNPIDTSRFFLLKPAAGNWVDINSPEDTDRLLDHIYYTRPALVVLDSLYTILPHCRQVSRKSFLELAALLSSAAADTQTAILLVTEAFTYVRRKR